jgi:hypothetical protein
MICFTSAFLRNDRPILPNGKNSNNISQCSLRAISLFTLDIADYQGKIGSASNATFPQWGFAESLPLYKR